jgi:hypothetical protein
LQKAWSALLFVSHVSQSSYILPDRFASGEIHLKGAQA